MDEFKDHQFHFDKQMILLFDRFTKFRIPKHIFDKIEFQKNRFSFAGFVTSWTFNPHTRILYHTKPKEIVRKKFIDEISGSISLFPEEHWAEKALWAKAIDKINRYAITGKI